MIFLVPGILAAYGLWKEKPALVVLAIGLFIWISWSRKQAERKRSRLFSVPMPPDTIPEFGALGGVDVAKPDCGCA